MNDSSSSFDLVSGFWYYDLGDQNREQQIIENLQKKLGEISVDFEISEDDSSDDDESDHADDEIRNAQVNENLQKQLGEMSVDSEISGDDSSDDDESVVKSNKKAQFDKILQKKLGEMSVDSDCSGDGSLESLNDDEYVHNDKEKKKTQVQSEALKKTPKPFSKLEQDHSNLYNNYKTSEIELNNSKKSKCSFLVHSNAQLSPLHSSKESTDKDHHDNAVCSVSIYSERGKAESALNMHPHLATVYNYPIGEKANLSSSLEHSQKLIDNYRQENATLKEKLNAGLIKIEAEMKAEEDAQLFVKRKEFAVKSLQQDIKKMALSENVIQLKKQSEYVIQDLKLRHQIEVIHLKEEINQLQRNLNNKISELENMQLRQTSLQKKFEEFLVENSSIVQKLSDLQASYNRNLLASGTKLEISQSKFQVQQLQEVNSNLEKKNSSLKIDENLGHITTDDKNSGNVSSEYSDDESVHADEKNRKAQIDENLKKKLDEISIDDESSWETISESSEDESVVADVENRKAQIDENLENKLCDISIDDENSEDNSFESSDDESVDANGKNSEDQIDKIIKVYSEDDSSECLHNESTGGLGFWFVLHAFLSTPWLFYKFFSFR